MIKRIVKLVTSVEDWQYYAYILSFIIILTVWGFISWGWVS